MIRPFLRTMKHLPVRKHLVTQALLGALRHKGAVSMWLLQEWEAFQGPLSKPKNCLCFESIYPLVILVLGYQTLLLLVAAIFWILDLRDGERPVMRQLRGTASGPGVSFHGGRRHWQRSSRV